MQNTTKTSRKVTFHDFEDIFKQKEANLQKINPSLCLSALYAINDNLF